MQNPLVSIVIPFKNTETYITDCLESIEKQTYVDFEVLAVDDGSTDDSRAITKYFSTKDARFKVFENTGKGIIDALQLAYSKASGTFVTRMDSDDIMILNKLEIMVNSLLANGKGHIAVGQVNYFSKDGVNDGYLKYEKWLNQLIEKGTNYSEIYKECVIPSPSWMAYTSDFDACGGFTHNTYPEDYDLAFRFYEHQLKCIPCTEVVHRWRDYSTRTSRTSDHYAENHFLDLKLDYFLKLDHTATSNLIVWGAGKKGKKIATKLIGKNIPFTWVCDNEKKIGKDIYGLLMKSYSVIENFTEVQIIITVANEGDQKFIIDYLKQHHKTVNKDYFLFC